MKTYTVTKTVQYIYTIEAANAQDAELFASVRSEDQAFQASLLDVSAESDEEYEASIEGVNHA
jgi:hypothetical protein